MSGSRVLIDGESRAELRGGEVISCRRPMMPLYLFQGAPPHRNEALERQLTEHDRDCDWLVYSDWLQQEGDPLGALLMRTHALPVGCARPDFLFVRGLKLEWRYCFWSAAVLEPRLFPVALEDEELLLALISFPQARLLRALRVDLTALCDDVRRAERLARALITVGLPRSIEHLELGPVNHCFSSTELRRRLPRWDGEPIANDKPLPRVHARSA
jgi:uncharacterized protein (TIGR02996 family)